MKRKTKSLTKPKPPIVPKAAESQQDNSQSSRLEDAEDEPTIGIPEKDFKRFLGCG